MDRILKIRWFSGVHYLSGTVRDTASSKSIAAATSATALADNIVIAIVVIIPNKMVY